MVPFGHPQEETVDAAEDEVLVTPGDLQEPVLFGFTRDGFVAVVADAGITSQHRQPP